MKTLFLILLISSLNIFPQWQKKYSPKVEEFIDILEEYLQNLDYIPHPDEFNLSDEELANVLKKMYEAIEDDPAGYINYFARTYEERVEKIKTKKLDENIPGIGNIKGLFRKKIEKKYTNKFLTLITTPYFLRVKIAEKAPSVYITKRGKSYDQIVVTGKVEEVIKGGTRFNEGNTISFMYLITTTCIRNYEIGKSYFIPFIVTTLECSNYEGLNPQWFDCKGNYLIENEIITIPENYFEIAEEIRWDEFKKQFNNKYINPILRKGD